MRAHPGPCRRPEQPNLVVTNMVVQTHHLQKLYPTTCADWPFEEFMHVLLANASEVGQQATTGQVSA
jgi:hypothetical protein